MKISKILLLLSLIIFVFGCEDQKEVEEENIIVLPGKADDFFALTAQEYVISGYSEVVLESTYATSTPEEKLERAKELIKLKHVLIGWFLNQYVVEKSHSSNDEYGGFKSLVKNGAWEDLEIVEVDSLTYGFKFTQLIGGTNDLLTLLPTTMKEDNKRHFDLIVGLVSNYDMSKLETNMEWYRSSPWSAFNPETIAADKITTMDLAIWPEERSTDAWVDYNKLFADGRLTVGVHFGWDYHDSYHEKHSESLYNWLLTSQYFVQPEGVESYADYTRNSGPLTKTIKANGKDVQIEISIYWGKTGTETDPDTDAGGIILENDMINSFENREVIVYSGHSGPLYGFALGNWKQTDEGDLDDSEIPFLNLPADVYQLVLAEGCDTYALGQSFFDNPAKANHKNIDIITTTNSSNASTPETVKDFLIALINTHDSGSHKAKSFSDIIHDMDTNSYWYNTMYGVHGIDDNPHLHPYADFSQVCETCSVNSDCSSQGMQCSRINDNEKVCTAECTDNSGCPEGYSCQLSQTSGWISSKQCVPLGYSCVNPDPPTGPQIIINEILADPAADLSGDSNGDGVRHFSDDEFVELVNISTESIDISGYTISDSYMVRFTFPENTIVAPNQAIIVFGGGDSGLYAEFVGALVFSAGGLGLNNTGDTVTLADNYGSDLNSMTYGSEGGNDKSLTRATDGDSDSSFIVHPVTSFSPGFKSDGSSF
jgi:Lamin Tail Domain